MKTNVDQEVYGLLDSLVTPLGEISEKILESEAFDEDTKEYLLTQLGILEVAHREMIGKMDCYSEGVQWIEVFGVRYSLTEERER